LYKIPAENLNRQPRRRVPLLENSPQKEFTVPFRAEDR
jgi:hypothetical protein